jgi:predicted nucleic acid-binding Zn ribbon protein
MAKRSNLVKLGDAISEILRQEKLDIRLSQFSVKKNWKEIAGELIAKNTAEIRFRDKTAYLHISSAALRHELTYRREELKENINRFCGYSLVDQVVVG